MTKAQVSVEYLLVLALSFLMLIPGLYLVLDYTNDSSAQIILYQINQIGQLMVETAQTVDGYGTDARIVVELDLPEGIRNISILNNTYLSIDATSVAISAGQLFRSEVNITGTFVPEDFSPGKKRFSIESRGDFVSITRV
jgi:hypothetical protein